MATKIWAATVATISDKWSVANRWTPSAPVTNDQIIIGNTTQTGAFTVTEDVTLTIASLTMAGNHKSNQTTTLSVTQPAALTVTGPINLGADSFINGTGTLIANGAISGAGTIIASNGGVLDIAGTGSIVSGVVLNFDVSSSLASTLRLDLSGGVTSAANIKLNNASQVLDVGPSTKLTISAQETIAKGTLRLSGGTVTDALGIIVGGQGAAGNIVGHGTLAADVSSGGAKATVNSLTASGGMLEVTGAFGQGLGGTLLGVIDSTSASILKFDSTAVLAQPIVINNALQTLEIGALGAVTITGLELVTNGTIKMDGGSLTDTSGTIIDTAATLVGKGLVTASTPLSGDGTVKASGGTLELGSDLSTSTTTFDVDTANGSILRIDGSVGAVVTLGFLGASGVLELADVSGGVLQGFNGKIAGLNVGPSATTASNEINIQAPVTKAVLSGSTITVFNGASSVATLALSAAPTPGAYAVVVADATLGGSDVFLSNQPPPAPTTLVLAPVSDSGTKGDNLTKVVTPTITGSGLAGDTITLLDGAAPVGSTTVGVGGKWSITAAKLTEGLNVISATQTDAFGNTSAASALLNITLDTKAPAVPAITKVGPAGIAGTAEAKSSIALFDGATRLGGVVTNGTGVWSIPIVLQTGTHLLTASATDPAGNISTTSTAVTAVIGSAGDDALSGGPGIVFMRGGAGNDTYTVNNPADVVSETVGQGTADTVLASTNYALPAGSEVEFLTGAGVSGLTLTGNEFANTISGTTGNDTLSGGSGNDTLNGGGGVDAMTGGAGNDTYIVDNSGDTVVEQANGGTDQVNTTLNTYTLGNNVENLTFTGTGNFLGTGNALPNVITGGTGNDTLSSGGGNDTLIGGSGNDTLNGGPGLDTMSGGAGDDTYSVENVGDTVNELANEGIDQVNTSLASFTLGANVENLKFVGTGNFAGTGNGLANIITGSTGSNTLNGGDGNDVLTGRFGNDTLDGGTGADTMTGNLGNDTYVVDNAGDVVIEQVNGGVDQVNTTLNSYTLGTNIENLSFIGAGDFVGVGNGLANVITGSTGNDTLTGGAGNDAFTFQLGFGHDIISDFDASPAGGQDHLDISALGITTATFGGSVTVAASGSDTLVTIGVNSIRLTGIAAAAIDTTDFRLA